MKHIIITLVFFISAFFVKGQTDIYIGRYITKDLHSGFCTNQIILNKNKSFVYNIRIGNDTLEVKGNWTLNKDTLILNNNQTSNQNIKLTKCVPEKFVIVNENKKILLESFPTRKECWECNTMRKL